MPLVTSSESKVRYMRSLGYDVFVAHETHPALLCLKAESLTPNRVPLTSLLSAA